jgi:hypothetical protein
VTGQHEGALGALHPGQKTARGQRRQREAHAAPALETAVALDGARDERRRRVIVPDEGARRQR